MSTSTLGESDMFRQTKTRIRYNSPSYCETCKHHDVCPNSSKHITECNEKTSRIRYEEDEATVRRWENEVKERFAELKASLRRVFSRQLFLQRGVGHYDVYFRTLTNHERIMNSHGHSKIRLAKKYLAWRKHCEQCGAKFETVNDMRCICDECWQEICGTLGVCYAKDIKKMLEWEAV